MCNARHVADGTVHTGNRWIFVMSLLWVRLLLRDSRRWLGVFKKGNGSHCCILLLWLGSERVRGGFGTAAGATIGVAGAMLDCSFAAGTDLDGLKFVQFLHNPQHVQLTGSGRHPRQSSGSGDEGIALRMILHQTAGHRGRQGEASDRGV